MASLTEINEGLAKIRFEGNAAAFYNPAQEFNRDLTVSVLRRLGKERETFMADLIANNNKPENEPAAKKRKMEAAPGFRILDALSASGLRALRFSKEVSGATQIVANDFSDDAVEIIKRNVETNEVGHLVQVSHGDATQVMSEHRTLDKRFHAVDLDPYGSASPFLNTAVQCVADRGILMVTCTDMAVLCGNNPESAMAKYGSTTFRHKSCHESAIRIVLRSIQQHAAMYDRYIEPLVCISVDFYIRCFVRMHTGAQKAKDGAALLSNVLYCTGCHGLDFQPLINKVITGSSVKFVVPRFASREFADSEGFCVHCRSPIQMAGPIYAGNYFNRTFVTELLNEIKGTPIESRLGTHDRLVGVLSTMLEELDDVPLYYELSQVFQICKAPMPKTETFRSAILNEGYQCSGSHCNPHGFKTNAPLEFIWDILRALVIKDKLNISRLNENSPGYKLMSVEPKHTINFKPNSEAVIKSRKQKLLRFQNNKGRNHGPKAKAKGSINSVKAAGFVVSEPKNQMEEP